MKENNTTKKIDDIVKKVEASEAFLKPNLDNWTRYYKLYRCFIDDDKWPTKTKIFNPYIFSAIETHTSKEVNQKPDGEFQPANPETQGDPEKVGLAFDHWWRLDRATFKGQSAFKKGLMYGSAMGRVFWKFRTGYIRGQKRIIDDRPSVRINRLEDGECGFDPSADCWENIGYAWEKYWITKSEMEDWLDSKNPEAADFDKKEVKKAIDKFDSGFDKNVYRTEKAQVSGSINSNNDGVKKVECLYLEDYETGDITITIGRKFIVKEVKNNQPFERSFVFVVDTIVPSEVLGMGEIEPVERMQHGLNLVQNQRRDTIQSVLKNQWIVGDEAEIDDDELTDEFNGIIHASDIGQIKPLFKPQITGDSFQEELSMKNDIANALAITDASKGSTTNLETAKSGRAIQMLQGAADARVQAKLQLFEVMWIKEIAEKWQRLASVYQKESLIVMESGKKIEIAPEEFKGEHNYFVESGSTTHTDKTQAKDEYLAYQKELIGLATLKEKSLAQPQPQIDLKTGAPQVDPNTGQPILPSTPPKVLNYDKMAEKLSDKFNVKDWRELWIMEEQQQPSEPQRDMLPSIDDQPAQGQSQKQPQEMLPSIDEEMPAPQAPLKRKRKSKPKEMLPSIDEVPKRKELLPAI